MEGARGRTCSVVGLLKSAGGSRSIALPPVDGCASCCCVPPPSNITHRWSFQCFRTSRSSFSPAYGFFYSNQFFSFLAFNFSFPLLARVRSTNRANFRQKIRKAFDCLREMQHNKKNTITTKRANSRTRHASWASVETAALAQRI